MLDTDTDTDTCIAIVKKHPVALKKLHGKSVGQVGISSITLGELASGAEKSSRSSQAQEALGEFLVALEVAGFDRRTEHRHGVLPRADFALPMRVGKGISS